VVLRASRHRTAIGCVGGAHGRHSELCLEIEEE
jgi:hypothetical protein